MNSDNIIADLIALMRAAAPLVGMPQSSPPSEVLSRALASGNADVHSSVMADELTELRAQLAEAKTDKKFSDMVGEVRTIAAGLNGRLDHIEKSTSSIKATVIGTGIAAVAVVIAMMTYGQAWFGLGISARDVVKAAISEYLQQHPAPPGKP